MRVTATGGNGVGVSLPGGKSLTVPVKADSTKVGDELLLGMRPEHLKIVPDGPLKGQAALAERLGSLTILHVEATPEVSLVVQAQGGDATPLHTPIALDIAPSACHLFNADGEALAPLQPA